MGLFGDINPHHKRQFHCRLKWRGGGVGVSYKCGMLEFGGSNPPPAFLEVIMNEIFTGFLDGLSIFIQFDIVSICLLSSCIFLTIFAIFSSIRG